MAPEYKNARIFMKKILLCTGGSGFTENIYRYGVWFAKRLNMAIQVLSVTDIRDQKNVKTNNLSGIIGFDTSKALLDQLVEIEHQKTKLNHQKAKLILDGANDYLTKAGIDDITLLHQTGFLVDCIETLEPQVDLIILGKRGEGAEFATDHLGSNIDRIIRNSQKPCLITPLKFKPIERLMLAYDGSKNGKKILAFLQEYPVFSDLELHIITVAKNSDDHSMITHLEEAKQAAKQAGFNPICQLLTGDPETAIASYEADNDIGLLLMGAYGHRRIRSLVIGSTTLQVLRQSQIPVLVFR
jgi:nucleotide-binding universal stress UspA family protein